MRYSPLWDITQRLVMIPYRRFGTTLQCHLQVYPPFRENLMFKGQETSVRKRHYTLRNILEWLRSHLPREGSVSSRLRIGTMPVKTLHLRTMER
jgi:hypothetical protein